MLSERKYTYIYIRKEIRFKDYLIDERIETEIIC